MCISLMIMSSSAVTEKCGAVMLSWARVPLLDFGDVVFSMLTFEGFMIVS